MSLNSILNNAYTGLNASQTAMRTISNNIANVNTPGFARQTVQFENVAAGDIGAGVKVAAIQRASDVFLERASYSASAEAGRYEQVNSYHSRFQGLLGRPDSESSLSARIDRVFSGFADTAVDPADSVRRQAVLGSVDSVLSNFKSLAGDLQDLRADASNQLDNTVNQVNELLRRIHKLNPDIVREKLVGQDIGPLQEQSASALRELSTLIDISVTENANGSMYVSTSSGVTLIDATLRQLDYTTPVLASPDTNFEQISVQVVDSRVPGGLRDTGQKLDGDIRSGKIRGLLDMRDKELPQLADTLGELARGFSDAVNGAHNRNTATPAPALLQGRNTGLVSSDALRLTGTTTVAIVNKAGSVLNKVDIDFSALGPTATVNDLVSVINTSLAGDATASFSNGQLKIQAIGAGNGIALGEADATATSRGGQGFSHFFGLNDIIDAQNASLAQTGVAAADAHGFAAGGTINFELRTGQNKTLISHTLTIPGGGTFGDLLTDLNAPTALGAYAAFSLDADGQLIMTPQSATSDLSLRVVSDTTSRGDTNVTLSDFFVIGQGAIATIANDLRIALPLQTDPMRLALARLDTTAVVGQTAVGSGDQRGAEALRDLQSTALSFETAGAISSAKVTLNQYAGFFLGDAAIKAERASTSSEDAAALQTTVIKRRDDATGVNLDEELANMLIFQNSYGASARLMLTARDMYDALLGILR